LITATIYRGNQGNNVGSVDVDWIFPEKMKGEFVKFMKLRPDAVYFEKVYYNQLAMRCRNGRARPPTTGHQLKATG
jgi:hypothetical protein